MGRMSSSVVRRTARTKEGGTGTVAVRAMRKVVVRAAVTAVASAAVRAAAWAVATAAALVVVCVVLSRAGLAAAWSQVWAVSSSLVPLFSTLLSFVALYLVPSARL